MKHSHSQAAGSDLHSSLTLLSSAMTCQGDSHPEISWNFEVHAPLLSAVFRHPTSNGPAQSCPNPQRRAIGLLGEFKFKFMLRTCVALLNLY